MKRISQDIETGQFQRVYLLYGSQAYLRNMYRDKLKNALIPNGDEMNYAYFDGKGIAIDEVISFAETMPFLADRRVIIIENSKLFEGACDELADYIPNMPETTCIIFSEEKVDKKFKLYKAVSKTGYVSEFTTPSPEDLRRWVMGKITHEHRQITGRALDLFLDIIGDDMLQISNELEKLLSYTFGKDGIYPDDVLAVCSVKIEDKIFDLLDAVMNGNKDAALRCYSDLLQLREEPRHILYMIERQLRIVLHVMEMDKENMSIAQMAKVLGMKEYPVKKTLPQVRRRSKLWVLDALSECADLERASKIGNMNAQISVEYLIVKLSS